MAIDRVTFERDDLWGKLVKTWATGKNYLEDGKSYPRPTTMAEFKQQCIDAKVGASIPAYITSIVMMQAAKEVMFIKLPPKDMVEDSEATLATEDYNLPPFYKRIFGGKDPDIDDKLKLHAERIGDYVIRICQ